MANKRLVGIHLKLTNSYTELLQLAHELEADACQFFFMTNVKDKYLKLTKKDRVSFTKLQKERKPSPLLLCSHGSYWINLATGDKVSSRISKDLLKKEIRIAQKLGINYIVLHAGTAKKFKRNPNDPTNKQKGIEALAKILNGANPSLDNTKSPIFLLENTAHGNKTVCSNLQDFIILRSLLKYPDRVKFCIDTAHAFAYGYNLEATDAFVEQLNQTMGIDNIKLIHLNDAAKPCGSKVDEHALPGEGLIGKKILKKIVNHPKLKDIPIIMEPPLIKKEDFKKIKQMIKEIKKW